MPSAAASKSQSYNVPAVRLALRLFDVLAESPIPLGVSELALRMKTNKHMTLRLVRTLQDEGWLHVAQAGPKYALGLIPFYMAAKVLARLDWRKACLAPLYALQEQTQKWKDTTPHAQSW